MTAFPTIVELANAEEDRVLRLWQGLGYYSRVRNLHYTAKYVANELKGNFPSTYSDIIKLKGVGPYTAAAIASICFKEPTPVVDGNVFRFAARYFGIAADISKSGTRKIFENVLAKEISEDHPGEFNQGMMEFGATVCSPSPQCSDCEFQFDCHAFANHTQKSLPVKTGKTKVTKRYFNYIVLKSNAHFLLKKREEKDVWSGLFDFFLVEGERWEEEVLAELSKHIDPAEMTLMEVSESFKHILSHQKIEALFFELEVSDSVLESLTQMTTLKAYSVEEMLNLPKPKLIVNYLQRKGIK